MSMGLAKTLAAQARVIRENFMWKVKQEGFPGKQKSDFLSDEQNNSDRQPTLIPTSTGIHRVSKSGHACYPPRAIDLISLLLAISFPRNSFSHQRASHIWLYCV